MLLCCHKLWTEGGSLHVKILKRSADFTPELKEKGAGALTKLQIPKKTKLFVDQTMRERENSIGMTGLYLSAAFIIAISTLCMNCCMRDGLLCEIIMEMNRIEDSVCVAFSI